MKTHVNSEGTLVDSETDGFELYVRRECRHGFTDEELVELNQMRHSKMRNGEHISSEDAASFARAVIEWVHQGLKKK